MPTYDELYEALRVLHVYCEMHECDNCAMSTNHRNCRITETLPEYWEFNEPRTQIWEVTE